MPGIEPASLWMPVGFINRLATTGTPKPLFLFSSKKIFFIKKKKIGPAYVMGKFPMPETEPAPQL